MPICIDPRSFGILDYRNTVCMSLSTATGAPCYCVHRLNKDLRWIMTAVKVSLPGCLLPIIIDDIDNITLDNVKSISTSLLGLRVVLNP